MQDNQDNQGSLRPASPVKIAVVGAGHVGSSFAYALLLSGLASEIVIVDVNRAKAEGEVMDLAHAAPFAPPVRLRAGGYEDCAGAVVTVVTAGANQKPGEPRLDLVRKNAGIFGQIIPAVASANPEGLLLIATNPVDVLTRLALQLSGLPPERVLGSGTILDTARFRHFIGQKLGVSPRSVSAHIIGEHGDSEVPVWSLASIAGMRLDDFARAQGLSFTAEDKDEIYRSTRDAAYHIIERKGATHYAIGAGLLEIVSAIVRDERAVLPVCSLIQSYNGLPAACFGLPSVVNRSGVARAIHLDLDQAEHSALQRSLQVLEASMSQVG